jgi:hypothetical protein
MTASTSGFRDPMATAIAISGCVFAAGAAILAYISTYVATWFTRNYVGGSVSISQSYTLHQLAGEHIRRGSSGAWVITVGGALLVIAAAIAALARHDYRIQFGASGLMAVGSLLITYVYFAAPSPPRAREIAGGSFIFWTTGSARNICVLAVCVGLFSSTVTRGAGKRSRSTWAV